MRIIISLIMIWIYMRGTHGIIGYDCGSVNSNYTTLSLLDIEECNIPLIQPESHPTYIQLLQLSKFKSIKTMQCKVVITRTIFYCGMHSHISTVENGHVSYIKEMTLKECEYMHRTGILFLERSKRIGRLKNGTQTRSVFFAGTANENGDCLGEMYSDPYGIWNNVVVQGTVTVTLISYQAAVNLEKNQIHLMSGTTCQYSDNNCVDNEGRSIYWNTIPTDKCKFSHYDVLYEGYASKMVSAMDEKSLILYTLSIEDLTFALSQIKEETRCGHKLIRTEHPKLLIWESKGEKPFLEKKNISVENLDIFTYVNSKFVYVERNIGTQMESLYRHVLKQRCDLEQQVMKNALILALFSPDEFAYQIMKRPGYMAKIAGEVAYIIKCIPVEVNFRHVEDCYLQLPVSKGNRSYFLTPRTHILLETGVQTTCSRIFSPMYFLNEWYRISSFLERAVPPIIIKPTTHPTWHFNYSESLAMSGIYTNDALEDLRDHIMFPVEKEGILNVVARGLRGDSVKPQQLSLSHLLDEKSMRRISQKTSIFTPIGNISMGAFGIYFFIRAINFIIDTLIHGYGLYSTYGCSFHLFGALWHSLANLLLHRKKGSESKRNSSPTEELFKIQPMQEGKHLRSLDTPVEVKTETNNIE